VIMLLKIPRFETMSNVARIAPGSRVLRTPRSRIPARLRTPNELFCVEKLDTKTPRCQCVNVAEIRWEPVAGRLDTTAFAQAWPSLDDRACAA